MCVIHIHKHDNDNDMGGAAIFAMLHYHEMEFVRVNSLSNTHMCRTNVSFLRDY